MARKCDDCKHRSKLDNSCISPDRPLNGSWDVETCNIYEFDIWDCDCEVCLILQKEEVIK